MVKTTIYQVGPAEDIRKQASMRADGQWFYRVRDPNTNHWGKWIKGAGRPPGAWIDMRCTAHAHLPQD